MNAIRHQILGHVAQQIRVLYITTSQLQNWLSSYPIGLETASPYCFVVLNTFIYGWICDQTSVDRMWNCTSVTCNFEWTSLPKTKPKKTNKYASADLPILFISSRTLTTRKFYLSSTQFWILNWKLMNNMLSSRCIRTFLLWQISNKLNIPEWRGPFNLVPKFFPKMKEWFQPCFVRCHGVVGDWSIKQFIHLNL